MFKYLKSKFMNSQEEDKLPMYTKEELPIKYDEETTIKIMDIKSGFKDKNEIIKESSIRLLKTIKDCTNEGELSANVYDTVPMKYKNEIIDMTNELLKGTCYKITNIKQNWVGFNKVYCEFRS